MSTYEKIETVLILAAGRGMRMMPLTNIVPKAMAPYANSTIIHAGITEIQKYIKNIYITVGYKGPILAEHVIQYDVSGVINTNGHGNSWWIFNTIMKYLDNPILVLTCDNITKLNFNEIEDNYNNLGNPPCMLIPVKPVEGLDGDYIETNNGIVKRISREIKSDIYCSGMQVINPKKINHICRESENFYDVWNHLIKNRELKNSKVYSEKWISIDTLEQLEEYENRH